MFGEALAMDYLWACVRNITNGHMEHIPVLKKRPSVYKTMLGNMSHSVSCLNLF